MKVARLNKDFSLTNIALKFSGSATEIAKLTFDLRLVGSKTLKNPQELIAFLDIYQLKKLMEIYPEELKEIYQSQQIIWSGKNFSFDLTLEPIVYSIINITPDSFYDGKLSNLELKNVLKKVESDIENGASVLDIGGKSSRPNFADISAQEEWLRIKEPIEQIKKHFPQAIISVDTNTPEVMKRVLDSGADILNDIDGFDTPEKLAILQEYKPSVLAMNNGRLPVKYSTKPSIELPKFFEEKVKQLTQIGLIKEQIALDAGVGFFNGPSAQDSVKRIKATEQLTRLGQALMIAISHKSFMPALFGMEKDETLFSTLMFELLMLEAGGRILRVHDVKETKRLIDNWVKYQNF